MFDELLSNLDAKLRVRTRLEIQQLHRELDITSLFATHDQVEAMTLAQRMMVMNAGRMEILGAERLLYCRMGEEFLIVRTDESRSAAPVIGAALYVMPRADRLHWLDAATGQRH